MPRRYAHDRAKVAATSGDRVNDIAYLRRHQDRPGRGVFLIVRTIDTSQECTQNTTKHQEILRSTVYVLRSMILIMFLCVTPVQDKIHTMPRVSSGQKNGRRLIVFLHSRARPCFVELSHASRASIIYGGALVRTKVLAPSTATVLSRSSLCHPTVIPLVVRTTPLLSAAVSLPLSGVGSMKAWHPPCRTDVSCCHGRSCHHMIEWDIAIT